MVDGTLSSNSWARISGLQSRPSLNGSICRLLFWHVDSERWAVRLPVSGESVRLRLANLECTCSPLPKPKVRGPQSADVQLLLEKMEEEVIEHLAGKIPGNAGASGIGLLFEALASSNTFVTEFFGRRPFVFNCGEASAHQWTLEDQVRLFSNDAYPDCSPSALNTITLSKYSKFTHPDIKHSKNNSFMAVKEDAKKDKSLTAAIAKHRLESATWVMGGCQSLSLELSGICSELQNAFEVPYVTMNVYTSRLDSAITAPLHTDRFDTFVFQSEGSKRWRVFETSQMIPKWPILDAGLSDRGKNGDVLYLEQVGPLVLDECLSPGDVLYLPRGHPHATSTFDTASLHGDGKTSSALYSTSLTTSLLLESVSLTYDKLLRCAAGMLEGTGQRGQQCLAAEEVLRATPLHENLREVLPIGFLARHLMQRYVDDKAEYSWAAALAEEAFQRATVCGLECLLRKPCQSRDMLRSITAHLENALPSAKACFRERGMASGKVLCAMPPDDRHDSEEKVLMEFPLYPEEGRMYTQAPSIMDRSHTPML